MGNIMVIDSYFFQRVFFFSIFLFGNVGSVTAAQNQKPMFVFKQSNMQLRNTPRGQNGQTLKHYNLFSDGHTLKRHRDAIQARRDAREKMVYAKRRGNGDGVGIPQVRGAIRVALLPLPPPLVLRRQHRFTQYEVFQNGVDFREGAYVMNSPVF